MLERNGAPESRLKRERGASADVPMNELFKLAVHRCAHSRWDVLVGPGIQFRRTVIRIEHMIGKTREGKE